MNKLSRKEKVCYGLGDMSSNIVFAAISFFLLYFMVTVAGVKPIYASLIFLVSKLWDAITDYLMGVISDRTKSKFGKRRIYMLLGALPYGLIFILLWLCPFSATSPQILKCLYYLGAYMLFNTAWTIVYVPYNALTANMTTDYDERTSLNGIRIILANVGLILGAAVFAVLADGKDSILAVMFKENGFSELQAIKNAYILASAIFGILAFIIMIVCTLNVKERYETEATYKKPLFTMLKEFFKLKEFRNTMLYYLLSMVGFDIIMAVFMFYVNYALKLGSLGDGITSMIFVAIPLIVAIATAMIWVKLSEKYNKVKVYSAAVIFISVVLLFCFLVPSFDGSNKTVVFISLGALVVAVGMGMSAVQILPYASVPDVIEVDEYVNKERREGAYYGIVSFMYKAASGIAVAVVSLILSIFGFQESYASYVEQSNTAIMAIRVVIGLLPGILFMISIIFGKRANLDRDRFNEIKAQIELRKQGEKNDRN